ncbi:MAG TPA: division/cell wall cluster transcriptional repressor MraZ [Balneolaceae bacterium]|nr:division/cell wall cluster transcriptional repressor MraZ [Balneolaceae bacterium]
MYSFKGQYEHSIDEKGRVSFPAKMRKLLSPDAHDRFVVVRGIESCLYLYPENEWQNVESALSKANNFTRAGRIAKRNFLRFAEDVSLDKQNRIGIPADHLTYAAIDSKAVFIGMGQYIEVWSPEKLNQADENLDPDAFEEIFEQVMGGGSTTDAD